eukprot:4703874-Pyramimonas_sp.AAC.1
METGAKLQLEELTDTLSARTDVALSAVCKKYAQMLPDKGTIIQKLHDQISTKIPTMHAVFKRIQKSTTSSSTSTSTTSH